MPEPVFEGQVRVPGYTTQSKMGSLRRVYLASPRNWEILSEAGVQEARGAFPSNHRGQVGWVEPPVNIPHMSLGLRKVNTYWWGEYIVRYDFLKLVPMELVVTLCDLPSSQGLCPLAKGLTPESPSGLGYRVSLSSLITLASQFLSLFLNLRGGNRTLDISNGLKKIQKS